jgi:hypothetical protein
MQNTNTYVCSKHRTLVYIYSDVYKNTNVFYIDFIFPTVEFLSNVEVLHGSSGSGRRLWGLNGVGSG